jgi:hypothetical protein
VGVEQQWSYPECYPYLSCCVGKEFNINSQKCLALWHFYEVDFLATWNAERERIAVPDHPGQRSLRDPFLNRRKLGTVGYGSHPSNNRKHKTGGSGARQTGQKMRPYLQNKQSKKGWRPD